MKAPGKCINKSFERIVGPNTGFTWGLCVILFQCERGHSPAIQSTSAWVWGPGKSADVPGGRLHRAGWAGGSWPLCLTSRQSEVIGSWKSHLSSTMGWVCAQHKNNISSIYTSEHKLLVSLSFAGVEKESVKGRGVFTVLYFFYEDRLWSNLTIATLQCLWLLPYWVLYINPTRSHSQDTSSCPFRIW